MRAYCRDMRIAEEIYVPLRARARPRHIVRHMRYALLREERERVIRSIRSICVW